MQSFDQRTLLFAKNVRNICQEIGINPFTRSYIDQVLRSSGSIGANYLEANETTSIKDALYRLVICRKEAKETIHWLSLLNSTKDKSEVVNELISECTELIKILSTMITKVKRNHDL